MKKKFAFIVPYFGKFHSWFQLWLDSCARNEMVDWIIFTDDKTPYVYPSNVIVHYCTFYDIISLVQSNFDFKVALDRPYKLCDFKPAYGEIFSDYLLGYKYWGFCDVDLIWGNLQKWLGNSKVEEYQQISFWGHCTLLKNIPEINLLYRMKIDGVKYYRDVFSSNKGFGFDEDTGFNVFSKYVGLKTYIIPYLDIMPPLLSYKFAPTAISLPFFSEAIKDIVVLVNSDGVKMYGLNEDKKLVVKEFAYVHLQRRNLKNEVSDNCKSFIIVPNRIIKGEYVDDEIIKKIRPSNIDAYLSHQNILWKSRAKYMIYKILK